MLNPRPINKQTLAEQVAASIEETIVGGRLRGGETLPTEPEIARQFGVSRAVVRDATRMLAAKGLVEVHHGKGVFVTHTQTEAFGDALLLALRRMNASNWDVAQFEQLIYPEIVALAAANALADDLVKIQKAAEIYLTRHAQIAERGLPPVDAADYQSFQRTWADFVQSVFEATHNKVIALLARPLIQLHGPRDWEGLPDSLTRRETQYVDTVIGLIRSGDPAAARQQMRSLMTLPPEAMAALQETAVATPTTIVLDSARVSNPS